MGVKRGEVDTTEYVTFEVGVLSCTTALRRLYISYSLLQPGNALVHMHVIYLVHSSIINYFG